MQVILTDIIERVLRMRQCAEYWDYVMSKAETPSRPHGMDLKVELMVHTQGVYKVKVKECAPCRAHKRFCTPALEGPSKGERSMLDGRCFCRSQHIF